MLCKVGLLITVNNGLLWLQENSYGFCRNPTWSAQNVPYLPLLDIHVCTCQRYKLKISETKEEDVLHLPHIEIFRKWLENEEHDLLDANKYQDISLISHYL